jgi:epidermal growth factor receptor substrate 15
LAFSYIFDFRPFRKPDDNSLGIILSNSLSLFFLSAIIIKAEENNSASSLGGDLEQQVFGLVLLVILLAGPFILIFQLLFTARRWLTGKRVAKYGQSTIKKKVKKKKKKRAAKVDRRASGTYVDVDAVFDAVKKGVTLQAALLHPDQGLKIDETRESKSKTESKVKQRLIDRAARFADELQSHGLVETKTEFDSGSNFQKKTIDIHRRKSFTRFPTHNQLDGDKLGGTRSATVGYDGSESMSHWMTMTRSESHNIADDTSGVIYKVDLSNEMIPRLMTAERHQKETINGLQGNLSDQSLSLEVGAFPNARMSSQAQTFDNDVSEGVALLQSHSAVEFASEKSRFESVVAQRRRQSGLARQQRARSIGGDEGISIDNAHGRHRAASSENFENYSGLPLRNMIAMRRGSARDLEATHLPVAERGTGLDGLLNHSLGEGHERGSDSDSCSSTSVESGDLNQRRSSHHSASKSSRSSLPSHGSVAFGETGVRDSNGRTHANSGKNSEKDEDSKLSLVAKRKMAGLGFNVMPEAAAARSEVFNAATMSLAERVAKRRGSFTRDLPHLDWNSIGGTGLDIAAAHGGGGGCGRDNGSGELAIAFMSTQAATDAKSSTNTANGKPATRGKKRKPPKKPTKPLSNTNSHRGLPSRISRLWGRKVPSTSAPASDSVQVDDSVSNGTPQAANPKHKAQTPDLSTTSMKTKIESGPEEEDEKNPFLRGSFDGDVPEATAPTMGPMAKTSKESSTLSTNSREAEEDKIEAKSKTPHSTVQVPITNAPPDIKEPVVDPSSSDNSSSDSSSSSDSDSVDSFDDSDGVAAASKKESKGIAPAATPDNGKSEGIDHSEPWETPKALSAPLSSLSGKISLVKPSILDSQLPSESFQAPKDDTSQDNEAPVVDPSSSDDSSSTSSSSSSDSDSDDSFNGTDGDAPVEKKSSSLDDAAVGPVATDQSISRARTANRCSHPQPRESALSPTASPSQSTLVRSSRETVAASRASSKGKHSTPSTSSALRSASPNNARVPGAKRGLGKLIGVRIQSSPNGSRSLGRQRLAPTGVKNSLEKADASGSRTVLRSAATALGGETAASPNSSLAKEELSKESSSSSSSSSSSESSSSSDSDDSDNDDQESALLK